MGIFGRIIYLCKVQTEWEFFARQLFMTTLNGNLCRRHTAAQRKFSAFLTIKLQENAFRTCVRLREPDMHGRGLEFMHVWRQIGLRAKRDILRYSDHAKRE